MTIRKVKRNPQNPKKRGRPAGVKNKPKQPIEEFKFPDEVEPRTPPVDYKELAQKLQNALAKSYVDIQDLERKLKDKSNSKLIEMQRIHLSIKQKSIDNLEYALCSSLHESGYRVDEDDEDSPV
jgi:hypothetical protein